MRNTRNDPKMREGSILKIGGETSNSVAVIAKNADLFFLFYCFICTDALENLRPQETVFVTRGGILAVREWEYLGQIMDFSQDQWTVPLFGAEDPLIDDYYEALQYDAQLQAMRRWQITLEEYRQLPEDGLVGPGFIEQRMARLEAAVRANRK